MADDAENIEIVICLGSSCFSRGNKQIVVLIQEYLKDRGLQNKIRFRGCHCYGKCDSGPVLQIGDTFIEKLSPDDIIDVLNEKLNVLNPDT